MAEFEFLSKTQSAVPLDRCFASLDPWQQDQILSDLCLRVKSSAWGLQIQLQDAPREAGWLLKLKGTVNYSAPTGAENENLGLLPFSGQEPPRNRSVRSNHQRWLVVTSAD
jgi:hypothetical protein